MMSFELKRVDNSNFKTHQSALAMPLMLKAFSYASCHPTKGSPPREEIKSFAVSHAGFGLYLWEKTGLTPRQRLQHSQVLYGLISF